MVQVPRLPVAHCQAVVTADTGAQRSGVRRLTMECLFCRLRDQQAGQHVFEDDRCFVLKDLNPQAPTHLLVLPKQHLVGPNAVDDAAERDIGHLVHVAARLARQLGIADSGYRLVVNCNGDAGQTVFHLHVHLLGGRQLQWPPG